MKRRAFIKKAGLTAATALATPYLLPSGRLFAASGSRKADHVVVCLFAGGVRSLSRINLLMDYMATECPILFQAPPTYSMG